MHKIRDINQFQLERQEQFEAAVELNKLINQGQQSMQLIASLKSGKRETIEALAVMRAATSMVYYVTALNRKDMNDQFEEFEAYDKVYHNLKTLLIGKSGVQPTIPNYDPNAEYIMVHDENDYGDNERQKFEKLFMNYANAPNVKFVFDSATPMSLMAVLASHIPPPPYVVTRLSPNYNGLVKIVNRTAISRPFLLVNKGNAMNFSTDFSQVLRDWLSQNQYTRLIVRDTGFSSKHLDKVKDLLRWEQKRLGFSRKANVSLVDKDNSYSWKKDNWEGFELIIVKQTFTRGTETNIQPHLFGYYDPRSDVTAFNTLMQALGRFCCYVSNSHIRLYLSKEGLNYVDAYNYMEAALQTKVPLDVIMQTLHTKFGIKNLSGNTKMSTNTSTSGTWSYTIFNGVPSGSVALLNKTTADKDRIIHAILTGVAAHGQQYNQWINSGFIEIDDLPDMIANFVPNAKYPNLLQEMKMVQQQYSIFSNGKIILQGQQVSAPTTNVNTKNKSVYNKLDQQGLLI